jgi:hypothetical protein
MKGVGWQIRPAGWLLLFVVAAMLTNYIIKWLRRPPDGNQEKT